MEPLISMCGQVEVDADEETTDPPVGLLYARTALPALAAPVLAASRTAPR